ncbi:MAG: hypothetical protein V3T86_11180 [Planctomycetota bacterium]
MTFPSFLSKVERGRARGHARRLAFRFSLVGALAVVVLLFAMRLGLELPGLASLDLDTIADDAPLWVGWFALSLVGLAEGLVFLAVVFLVGWLVRLLTPWCFRRGATQTANEMDRRLETDRFAAALQATGPLAGLTVECALRAPPSLDVLVPARSRRRESWLRRLAVLLVIAIAILPGRAGAGEGPDDADGESNAAESPLVLRLSGLRALFRPGDPIPMQVMLEANAALEDDFQEDVFLQLDDKPVFPLRHTLFLAAGAPGQDVMRFDLLRYAEKLAPGEHVVVAVCGELESNEFLFRIDPEGDGGGGGSGEDPPEDPGKGKPKPGQQEQRPQKINAKPKFVQPLVRDGDKVKKRARVLTETRGGSDPVDRPLEEAWPELQRRKEAALKRPGLSPAARRLVQEYFERLRPDGVQPDGEEK